MSVSTRVLVLVLFGMTMLSGPLYAQTPRLPTYPALLPSVKTMRFASEADRLGRGALGDLEKMYDDIMSVAEPSAGLAAKRVEFGKEVAATRKMMAAFKNRAAQFDATTEDLSKDYSKYKQDYDKLSNEWARQMRGYEKVLNPPVCPECNMVHEEDRPSPQALAAARRRAAPLMAKSNSLQNAANELRRRGQAHQRALKAAARERDRVRRELQEAIDVLSSALHQEQLRSGASSYADIISSGARPSIDKSAPPPPIIPRHQPAPRAPAIPVQPKQTPFAEPEEPFKLDQEEWGELSRQWAQRNLQLDDQKDALLLWLYGQEGLVEFHDLAGKDPDSTEVTETLTWIADLIRVKSRTGKRLANIEQFKQLALQRQDMMQVKKWEDAATQVEINDKLEVETLRATHLRSREWSIEMNQLRTRLRPGESITKRERDDPQFAAEMKAAFQRVWTRYEDRVKQARQEADARVQALAEVEEDPDKLRRIRAARIKWAVAATKVLQSQQNKADSQSLKAYGSFVDRNMLKNQSAPLATQVKTDPNAQSLVVDYLIPIRNKLWAAQKIIRREYLNNLNAEVARIRGATPGIQ